VIRLAVRVRCADAELVLAELLQLAPSGVEETQLGDELVEYAVYGAPGELPELPDLRAAAGGALVEIATSKLPDDWSERWKRFHRPVLVEPPASRVDRASVPGLCIRPPWEPSIQRPDIQEIVIDPGQAFGTGAHATTRLCLELLLELTALHGPRGPLLDVGTGSGVLAIAAARLGYGPVLALDHDPESVAAAAQNASVNGVSIEISRFDLRDERLPTSGNPDVTGGGGRFGGRGGAAVRTVLANLLRPLLLELSHSMDKAPGDLIAGGLLAGEVDEVVLAFSRRHGMRERERRHEGEWAAVWLVGK
jgi:ribosomal protein L11 methyltransferase